MSYFNSQRCSSVRVFWGEIIFKIIQPHSHVICKRKFQKIEIVNKQFIYIQFNRLLIASIHNLYGILIKVCDLHLGSFSHTLVINLPVFHLISLIKSYLFLTMLSNIRDNNIISGIILDRIVISITTYREKAFYLWYHPRYYSEYLMYRY